MVIDGECLRYDYVFEVDCDKKDIDKFIKKKVKCVSIMILFHICSVFCLSNSGNLPLQGTAGKPETRDRKTAEPPAG